VRDLALRRNTPLSSDPWVFLPPDEAGYVMIRVPTMDKLMMVETDGRKYACLGVMDRRVHEKHKWRNIASEISCN